jgi:hypothetical protein
MSTQHTRLLFPIPQSEFLQFNSRFIDDLKIFHDEDCGLLAPQT